MSDQSERFLYWTPRTLAILFALFISMFALDVFAGSSTSLLQTAIALTIHLLPTAILLAVLYIAWRWELPGAVLFAALGLVYWVVFPHHIWMLAAAPVVIGGMFLIHWITEHRGSETHFT